MVNRTLGKPVRHIRAALFLHMSVLQHQFQGMDVVFGGFLWKHKDTIGWFAIWRWGFVWILFNLIVSGELLKRTLLCINYCPALERTQYQLQALSVLRWMTTMWGKIIDPYCSWLCCYFWVGWFFLPKGPKYWCWWYSGEHSCLPRAPTYKPLKWSLGDRIYRENSRLVIRTLLTLHRPLLEPRVDISSSSWVLTVSVLCIAPFSSTLSERVPTATFAISNISEEGGESHFLLK